MKSRSLFIFCCIIIFMFICNILQNRSRNCPIILETFHINGEEPKYDPDRWKEFEKYNNCYAYALDNNKKRNSKPQPNNKSAEKYNCKDLQKWISEDLVDTKNNKHSLLNSSKEKICPKGYHKIYLVTSGDDYHFYRLDNDGLWSHKPGGGKVTRLDAENKIIEDPSTANHNYEAFQYNTSCGFLCTPNIQEKF
jgi:hypothetical protein